MTHRLSTQGRQCSLPLPMSVYKPKPFYSLFERKADKTWKRLSINAYADEKMAVKIYLSQLAEAPISRAIRKVFINSPLAGKHRGISFNEFRDSPLRDRGRK